MALRDMLDRVRDQVSQMAQRFLHEEGAGYGQPGYGQPGYGAPEGYYDPNQPSYPQENPSGYAPSYEGAYQQQYQQQPYQQQQYQQPQPDPYAAQQEGYQSPYAGSYGQPVQGHRTAARAAYRAEAEKVVPFPGMVSDTAGNTYAHELQILQLRDRDECKSIIEYLKNNCTVAINMDSIANDTEKQRCVDMLSGAAYTLGCQISRISPRGVYLITPAAVRVQQDEATRRMNGGARPAATAATQRPTRAHSYAGRGPTQPEESQEAPEYAFYQPQAEYAPNEGSAPGGYQPYNGNGEYRSSGYYASEPRRAVGYGR